jgi:hypothetical protein
MVGTDLWVVINQNGDSFSLDLVDPKKVGNKSRFIVLLFSGWRSPRS